MEGAGPAPGSGGDRTGQHAGERRRGDEADQIDDVEQADRSTRLVDDREFAHPPRLEHGDRIPEP